MATKTIIVTGGAGYIGSHACKLLKKAGFNPITVDNLSNGFRESVKFGPFEEVDLLDSSRLEKVFDTYLPVGVLHFAAFAYVEESVKNPEKYHRNNVVGSKSLFETMVKKGCKKLIFSSSCAVYGMPQKSPIDESESLKPVNPYGETKKLCEEMLQKLSHDKQIKYMALRYFNAAGSDPEGEIGENHDPETHVIPLCLQTAAGIRPEFNIFGTDYDTSDGSCVRDYVHVNDLIDAHIKGLDYLEKNDSIVCNLGTGRGFSVREIVETVKKVTGRNFKVKEAPRREGDPSHLVADNQRARSLLGWSPQHSDLETQIRHSWQWFSSKRQ